MSAMNSGNDDNTYTIISQSHRAKKNYKWMSTRGVYRNPINIRNNTIIHGNQNNPYNGGLLFQQGESDGLNGVSRIGEQSYQDTGKYERYFQTSEQYQNQNQSSGVPVRTIKNEQGVNIGQQQPMDRQPAAQVEGHHIQNFVLPENISEMNSRHPYDQQGLTYHPLAQQALIQPTVSQPAAQVGQQNQYFAVPDNIWAMNSRLPYDKQGLTCHPLEQQAMNESTWSQLAARVEESQNQNFAESGNFWAMYHPAASQPAPTASNHQISSQTAAQDMNRLPLISQSPAQANKPRLRWTPELQERFLGAVQELGGCFSAMPSAIVKKMNVRGITVYHVKSHLQRFRKKNPRPITGNQVNQNNTSNGVSQSPHVESASNAIVADLNVTGTRTFETQITGENESLIRSSENFLAAPKDEDIEL